MVQKREKELLEKKNPTLNFRSEIQVIGSKFAITEKL